MKDYNKKLRKLTLRYNFIGIVTVLLFYPFILQLLNYPTNSINNESQIGVNVFTYTQMYLSILAICVLVENIVLLVMRKKLSKLLIRNDNNKYVDIIRVIEKTSQIIYLLRVIIPVISITCILLLLNVFWGVIVRILLLFFSIFLLSATLSYVFCRGLFKELLIEVFNESNLNNALKLKILNKLKRHSIKSSVILLVVSLLILTAELITSIIYSKYVIANGRNIYKIYTNEIAYNISNEYSTFNQLENTLNKINLNSINDGYFILTLDGDIVKNNITVSDFFIKYITNVSMKNNKNITYEIYESYEGIFKIVKINNQPYILGFKYATSSPEMIFGIVTLSIIIIITSIVLLLYALNYIFREITVVTRKLSKMSKAKTIDLKDNIPISSNDEISDLIKAFTAVQEKTDEYIQQIEQDQYTMQRQAQFAIIGEFAGGLAHDLNSPLSAVKLDISTLKKYMNSNKITAEEDVVNKLNGMLNNIDNSLNSMGNIIMGIRNQIRATGDSEKEEFILRDVVDGIKILFRSILMKNNCQLEYDIPDDLTIYGEKNKLDRIIGNLVKNSIDAYVSIEKKGIVKIDAYKNEKNTIIAISDEAGGVNEEIKDKIFKEIKTTKSENGTGFGLYYSNTIIESSFKGKMYFDSNKGVGTTFYIEIPNIKEEK